MLLEKAKYFYEFQILYLEFLLLLTLYSVYSIMKKAKKEGSGIREFYQI